jgi:hypothetical protein
MTTWNQGRVAGSLVMWPNTSAPPGGVSERVLLPQLGPRNTKLFLPNTVGTNRLWYRSDLGLTMAGADVTTWADQGGAARDLLTVDALRRPTVAASVLVIDGQPTVVFDGVAGDTLKTAVAALPQPFEVYLAFRLNVVGAAGANDMVFDGGIFGNSSFEVRNTPLSLMFAGAVVSAAVTVGNPDFVRLHAVYDGVASSFDVGGATLASGDAGAVDADGFELASFDPARCASIEVAEALVYWPLLAPADRTEVASYLALRYNL